MTSNLQRAFRYILRQPVISYTQLHGGKTHTVYKAVTPLRGAYIIKVFRPRTIYQESDRPEHHKLLWIHYQLAAKGVPNAQLIRFAPEHKLFPGGFVAQQFIPGRGMRSLVESGKITEREYYQQLGRYLRNVHQITLPRYGSIDQTRQTFRHFSKWKAGQIVSSMRSLNDFAQFSERTLGRIQRTIDMLAKYEKKFRPVLVHNDPWPSNGILTKERQLVMIDWDEAFAGIWLVDLASVTYTNMILPANDRRHREKITAFFEGYVVPNNLTSREVTTLLRSLHVINAANLLSYAHYHTHNRKDAVRAKRKLLSLLY